MGEEDSGGPIGGIETCRLCTFVVRGDSRSEFDRHWLANEEFILTPALGMFVPGYFLVTSKSHRLAIAPISNSFQALYDETLGLRRPFGDYMAFEHATSLSAPRAGPCISHAHAHLLPVSESCFEFVLESIPGAKTGNWSDAMDLADEGYVYLSYRGRSFVASAGTRIRGQWLRRKVAEFLAIDSWDWSLYYGQDELRQTIERLSGTGWDHGTAGGVWTQVEPREPLRAELGSSVCHREGRAI
jgi:hypothetical protein